MGDPGGQLPLLLEELAANAWPALVQQQLGGWRLRAANGATRRANSVLALGDFPSYADWMSEITGFYSRRGLPVRFSISEAAPADLDEQLEHAGYEAEAHSSVQTVSSATLLEKTSAGPRYEADISEAPDPARLSFHIGMGAGRQGKEAMYTRILSGIGPRTAYAMVSIEGEPAGVGLCVLERGWGGLFDIATTPAIQQKGVATRVVGTLAEWAASNGAANIYLQVMLNNRPALNLYRKLGFAHQYGYHYRTLNE